MADQYPLFDAELGERLKQEGMDRVDGTCPSRERNQNWKARLLKALHFLITKRLRLVHADDLMAVLDEFNVPWPEGVHDAIRGVVWREAISRGWIENTGQMRKSARPQCHKRESPIYRSLIYKGEESNVE